jgi:hypothetical protein
LFAEKLAAAGQVNNSFSMCLGFDGGVLQLGGMDSKFNTEEPKYTPLLEELYYVVNMTDLEVGEYSLGKKKKDKKKGFSLISIFLSSFKAFPLLSTTTTTPSWTVAQL